MIRHVFRFEWLHLMRSRAFQLIAFVLPVTMFVSLYLGQQRVSTQLDTITELAASERAFYLEQAERQRLIEQGELEVSAWFQDPGNPLVLAQFNDAGRFVILHPRPLAALAVGQSDIFPYYGKVTLTNRVAMRDNALKNPVTYLSGSLDFAFVLIWLIPLFVIALGYDVRSREKESGTYVMLESQPVSVTRIMACKFAFRYSLLLLMALSSLALFSVILQIPLASHNGLIVVLYITGYMAFWFLLSVVVTMFSNRSAMNAISLVGLWVLFILIIPALITLYAGYKHPLPSRSLWVTELRAIEQEVNARRGELFDAWKADHPEEYVAGETPGFYQTWMQRLVSNTYIHSQTRDADERFQVAVQRQHQAIHSLRLLSPPMILSHRLQVLAGTDRDRLGKLDEKMYDFQREWQDFFLPRFQQLNFFTSEEIQFIPVPERIR